MQSWQPSSCQLLTELISFQPEMFPVLSVHSWLMATVALAQLQAVTVESIEMPCASSLCPITSRKCHQFREQIMLYSFFLSTLIESPLKTLGWDQREEPLSTVCQERGWAMSLWPHVLLLHFDWPHPSQRSPQLNKVPRSLPPGDR